MENNSAFWKDFEAVDSLLKQAFIQMPGGQAQAKEAQDPAAGGMPPPGIDPAAMGAMPPPGIDQAAMGGAPMDPAMAGVMPPPGMDPAAMGVAPMPMDPMMGGLPPPPGADGGAAPESAPGSPMITISLDQLFEIIQKVLGLAKKVGANGQGIQQAAPEAQPGLTADQLKSTIYEALASMGGNGQMA